MPSMSSPVPSPVTAAMRYMGKAPPYALSNADHLGERGEFLRVIFELFVDFFEVFDGIPALHARNIDDVQKHARALDVL